MPRNVFENNEPWICESCREGKHWKCDAPGVCRCEEAVDVPVDTTPPEKMESDDPVLEVAERRLAQLRTEEGFTTTETHLKNRSR